jgi:hypothetical protein
MLNLVREPDRTNKGCFCDCEGGLADSVAITTVNIRWRVPIIILLAMKTTDLSHVTDRPTGQPKRGQPHMRHTTMAPFSHVVKRRNSSIIHGREGVIFCTDRKILLDAGRVNLVQSPLEARSVGFDFAASYAIESPSGFC